MIQLCKSIQKNNIRITQIFFQKIDITLELFLKE